MNARRTRMKAAGLVGIVGIFFISLGLTAFVTQAGAETMKLRVYNVVTKGERCPVGDVEGHNIVYMMREGIVTLENGEAGSMKALVVNHATPKGGSFLGYLVLSFVDGSTMVIGFEPGKFSPDPAGKLSWTQEARGELISGSGRFQGIKGTMSMSGSILKPAKEEFAGKAYNDFVLTYTLPAK